MKLNNFRRFDPDYTAAGHVGLTRGNKLEEAVWNDFADAPEKLARVAQSIRLALLSGDEGTGPSWSDADDEGAEAAEGRLLTRLHRSRERNRNLVKRKKAEALNRDGKLLCAVCGFDFAVRYGPRGEGFIECHHTKPVSELQPGSKTRLADLALVCANCHRMIHAAPPWPSIAELRAMLR